MIDHSRYVIDENIERFERLLRSGRLDARQAAMVGGLLAQAREELAQLEARDGRAMAPGRRGSVAVAC